VRESEDRFRLKADTAPVMVWMSAQDTLCDYFNRRWLEFTGRSLEEELGNGWTDGVHPDDFGHTLETYLQAFDKREPFRMEYRLRRHDSEYRWVLDSGVPRFKPDGSFAGYIGSAIDITDQKLARDALSNLSQRLMQVQEEERAFVARELHDDLAQRATALAMRLHMLERALPQGTSEHDRVQELCDQARKLAKDIPALSHRLHSVGLAHLGIAKTAESLCKELSEQYNVSIDFTEYGMQKHLSKEVAICLFRVLQEALQNAIKHSGSRHIQVTLGNDGNAIDLTVHDTGLGFNLAETNKGLGLGLTSMRERLKLVDGQLSIDSNPGSGTTIYARVPLDREKRAVARRPESHGRSVSGDTPSNTSK
jgi:PAS domain S-box-containing protein